MDELSEQNFILEYLLLTNSGSFKAAVSSVNICFLIVSFFVISHARCNCLHAFKFSFVVLFVSVTRLPKF